VNGHVGYLLAGMLDGAAAALFISGLYLKRAAKRRVAAITDLITHEEDKR